MPLLIDTAVVPASDRVEFWSESSRRIYHPLQVRSAAKGAFWGRLSGYELGPLGVFRVVAAPNTMIRTGSAIAAGDPECVHVATVLRGRLNAAQGGRTCVARVGDMICYETSHPVLLRSDGPFESLVVRVPRDELGPDAAHVGSRTAVRFSGRLAATRNAAAYLRKLVDRLEHGALAPETASIAADGVLDLVRTLITGPGGGVRGPSELRSRAEILLTIESFIEANLGDPELDPEEIARASFISTRYLHKLFEAEGTSVCRWVRTERLDRCRRDLADRDLDHWTILAIASRWGLPGPQHFSRLFRAEYGCSPREFRRDARVGAPVPLTRARGAGRGSGLLPVISTLVPLAS